MNKRIRELYEQARLQAKNIDADLDPQGWMDLYHQKFAELIVRECMNVLDPGEHQLIARFHARQWLAEHFGVEE